MIFRTLPPAAAPIRLRDFSSGITGMIRGKQEIEDFTESIKEAFHHQHCFLVSSGKAALTLILQAVHALQPSRDEVLIPAYTCYSVPSAIVRAGLKVKLCDVNPETLNFDEPPLHEQFEENQRLPLAVIPVHLFGRPVSIQWIKAKAEATSTWVIEDAAQAMGSKSDEDGLGGLGDVSFFSLGRGKALSAVEGGVILTDNDSLASKLESNISTIKPCNLLGTARLMASSLALSFLLRPSMFWLPKSLPWLRLGETIYDPNFPIQRFTAFQAGLTRSWRAKLQSFQKKRQENVAYWRLFLKNPMFHNTLSVPDLSGFENHNPPSHAPLIRFPVLVRNLAFRQAFLEQSDQQGLGIMPGYPDSIDHVPEIRHEFQDESYPGASELARSLITLPTHPLLSPEDRDKIARLLLKLFALDQ